MKRALLITLVTLLSAVCFAQNVDPIRFLDIPVDGSEAQFIEELKAIGFTFNDETYGYMGQFNGQTVNVFVHTNHNVVDRIFVAFPFHTAKNVKTEFNNLIDQFNSDKIYTDLVLNDKIPTDEDIAYQITVNNKCYEASFSFFSPKHDPMPMLDALLEKCSEFFTTEQMAKLKEDVRKATEAPEDQKEALRNEMIAEMQKMGFGQPKTEAEYERALRYISALIDGMRSLADGEVWFTIYEYQGRYHIGLYYVNLPNQALGENL